MVSAAVHVPRKRWERAWTGTSHSAEGGRATASRLGPGRHPAREHG